MFLSASQQLRESAQIRVKSVDAEEEVLGGQEDVALERPLALHVVPEALHALLAHSTGARQRLKDGDSGLFPLKIQTGSFYVL